MEFVFFCGAGDGTQDLALAKQALLLRWCNIFKVIMMMVSHIYKHTKSIELHVFSVLMVSYILDVSVKLI
jgi:hypothetical protein